MTSAGPPVMLYDDCRGVKTYCGATTEYRVTLAYEGATRFPAAYDLCAACLSEWLTVLGKRLEAKDYHYATLEVQRAAG